MLTVLIPLFAGLWIAVYGPAAASPVAQSLRPEARPSPQAEAKTEARVLTTSPRPMGRPTTLTAQPRANTAAPGSKDRAFQGWLARYKAQVVAQGIRPDVAEAAFRGIRYNASIVKNDRNQAEFKRQIWDYLDSAASPVRVKNGKAALARHGRILTQIERAYGVEKEVVLAVWGMETAYGERRGTLDVIEALATLAYDGRRGAFFEKQLFAALQILQSGDVSPRAMKGSWAGAMGHTQFIPTSYLAYAVDFTGDGKRDIWSDDPTDALASTAAYLQRHGWQKGQPWGIEVRLPAGFDANLASRKIKRSPAQWAQMGITDMSGRAPRNHGPASILLPAGLKGPAFMIFDNFTVITRYNNSTAYVMGVGHLSDRIKGGGEFVAPWPRGYAALSYDERLEMQRRLQQRGFEVEKIDGIIGPNTVAAIRAFQTAAGVAPDGFPSQDVLKLLRAR